ncbi:MAG TPA: DUF2235 domain-containing protein [Allosphingosinicella sp.]|nr:DUF2235 domain-containing protein [Allosphingosinicella sp.]
MASATDDRIAAEAQEAMPPAGRNIVICCDGTGNQVSGNLSNVLKLFRIARKDKRQRIFYDPGVGTIGNDNAWRRFSQDARAIFGLATGAGLDDNIIHAYRFLAEVWEPGDRIFLFGFSRGAYTVRVLAGFLHMVGLIRPDQANIGDYALTAYKQASAESKFQIAWDFGRVAATRRVTIHFLGVWDTVASMIVPRPDRFYLPSLRTLPYTRTNPSVRTFRQAMAIDERRRMFRLNRWVEPQPFIANPFAKPPVEVPQDIGQQWFAGVHSDIGGGYPEAESGLSKLPLIWMIDEAVKHGLRIDQAMYDHLALGQPMPDGRYPYVPPDPCGELHKSLTGFWWVLEYLCKNAKWREWPRLVLFGWYWPRGEPRPIETGADLHPSVAKRQAECVPPYKPVNLPPRPPLPPEGWLNALLHKITAALKLLALLGLILWLVWRWWW